MERLTRNNRGFFELCEDTRTCNKICEENEECTDECVIQKAINKLDNVGTVCSLFIDPVKEQIDAAVKVGAPFVEFHTGRYANATNEKTIKEGTVDFLIDQNGFFQGYRPLYILTNMLMKHVMPEEEYLFTEINIKTKYNL